MPITTTSVEDKPCLDPSAVSRDDLVNYDLIYYTTELDRLTPDCQIVPQFNEKYDTRYIDLDFEVTEYEVQDENGVKLILQSQPLASQEIDFNMKHQIEYDFWGRPTIEWRLDCEASDSTR